MLKNSLTLSKNNGIVEGQLVSQLRRFPYTSPSSKTREVHRRLTLEVTTAQWTVEVVFNGGHVALRDMYFQITQGHNHPSKLDTQSEMVNGVEFGTDPLSLASLGTALIETERALRELGVTEAK